VTTRNMAARIGATADTAERVGVESNYLKKEWFEGRRKSKLGDTVGLTQLGVNYTILEPGAYSALRHWHEGEDEFIYVLEGVLTLIDDNGEHELTAGSFAGFPAGVSNAHHLHNQTTRLAIYLEVGSKRPGADTAHYPDDDFGPVAR